MLRMKQVNAKKGAQAATQPPKGTMGSLAKCRRHEGGDYRGRIE